MSKNTKRLLIMLCAVLLMGGILALLLSDSGDELITEDEHEHESAGNENALLVDRSTIDLRTIAIKNRHGSFTIKMADNGDLFIDELTDIPINTGFLDATWYSAVTVGFSNQIALPEDGSLTLASYGLDKPQTVFTTTYADGTGNTVRIGSEISPDSDTYYFQIDSDPAIYVTTFDFSFFQGEKYWISDDLFRTSYDGEAEITRIAINLPQLGEKMVIVPHKPGDKSDPWQSYKYIFTSPETCAADNYIMTSLTEELSWLTAYEAVVAHPTKDDIAAYGLDKPYAVLDVTRSGTEHHLVLAKYDYNTLYAMADDVPVIYQIDASSNTALASLSMRTLRSPDVHIRYFDAIESITVRFDGREHVFRIERVPMNDSSELYEYSAFCGDVPLSLSNVKAMLEIFNHAAASEYTSSAPDGEPYLTVVIDYFDSFDRQNETITYTENGTRRYLCRIDGVGSANVTEMWMNKFITGVQTLAAGETVIP